MYARYRTRSKFYKRGMDILHPYSVQPNVLRKPKVKQGLLSGIYFDEKVDLREKERLELLESLRHPKERDFYQDHTYHNQWISRQLEKHQKTGLASRYKFFHPDYAIQPWLWFPGDLVEVTEGKYAGQRGTIIAVVKYKNEIIVQNINVRDVHIPATETRPEQIVQREHPISVTRVRHVDPSTQLLCHLQIVQVRNKETQLVEEKRISMESGVVLPIPSTADEFEVGDPLLDTPIHMADEATYDPAVEMPRLVERKLEAMESYFVQQLRTAYEFHTPLATQNGESMKAFQAGVVRQATRMLVGEILPGSSALEEDLEAEGNVAGTEAGGPMATGRIASGGAHSAASRSATDPLPDWLQAIISPYVQQAAERDAQQRAAAAAATAAAEGAISAKDVLVDDEDVDFEEDQVELED